MPELILSDRRVYVDSHGAGGRRNSADPLTRHRNTGCCSERVAHFVSGLHDPPGLCRKHYVFAGISSKCRCAKCEREHGTRAPNRRTAQATKPVFHSHTVIVIPFRIWASFIKWRRDPSVVLVNCQLVGGAHEGQPGFTLVFAKAVLLHQWVQSAGLFWSQSS